MPRRLFQHIPHSHILRHHARQHRRVPPARTYIEMYARERLRDLSIYAQALGGEVRHYRDNAGLECDAVVHLEDGRFPAPLLTTKNRQGFNR